MAEIKKQKIKEASMAHAKKALGPDEFKNNKEIAKAIAGVFEAGVNWAINELQNSKEK